MDNIVNWSFENSDTAVEADKSVQSEWDVHAQNTYIGCHHQCARRQNLGGHVSGTGVIRDVLCRDRVNTPLRKLAKPV